MQQVALALSDIAVRYGCEVLGDPDATVNCVATLSGAAEGSISFLANPAYRAQLADTRATAVILTPDDAEQCATNCLTTANPYAVYALVAQELYPEPPGQAGVHPAAVIGEACELGDGCRIAAGAVLGNRVKVGANTTIGPNCAIEDDVSIGRDCRLMGNASLYREVVLGDRCRLHSGVVIGADGFGMAPGDSGWIKVPQVGTVVIGNDVEIGANSCVDRGAIDDTRIGNDVKIDNLVQIGHNVVIGDHTAMAGMSGVAGSTTIGQRCLIGGAATIGGHIEVANDVSVMGRGNVSRSITQKGVYSSVIPVEEAGKWRKIVARLKRIDSMASKLHDLEKAVRATRKNGDETE
jgi:UDP-3-O-[3-hydroxymyristoyl] glucosamine N-acyltransferase